MVAPRFKSGRKKNRLRRLLTVAVTPLLPVTPPLPPELLLPTVGGENCCVVAVPMVLVAPVLNRFTPNCVSRVRSTLANFTFRRI